MARGTEHACVGSRPLPDEELQLLVDGELSRRRAAAAREHVAACPSCRERAGRMQAALHDLAAFVDGPLTAALPDPPAGWATFAGRLQEAASRPRPSAAARLRGAVRRILAASGASGATAAALRWGTAAAAAVSLLLVLGRLAGVATVSADELLERARGTHARRVAAVARAVVHQRLQVRVSGDGPRAETASWQVWGDTTRQRFRRRATAESIPALLAEFGRVLDANGMDARWPLSAESFDTWRRRLPEKEDTVRRAALAGGEAAYVLTTVPGGVRAVGAITEARLVVRAVDWHPVEERLVVMASQGRRVYELVEGGFEVVPLEQVAQVFEPEAPVPPPGTSGPTAAELAGSEMEARYALHRIQADLGEPLELARRAGGIEVRGLVDAEERKSDVLAALRDIPHVTARIETVSGLGRAPRLGVHQQRTAAEAVSAAATPPIEELLGAYLAEEPARGSPEAFSADLLRQSELALARAWALRRLGERYSAEESGRLSPRSRSMLVAMIRAHLDALRDAARASHSRLAPFSAWVRRRVARSPAEPPPPTASGPDWPAGSARVFDAVIRSDRLLTALFTAGGPAEPADAPTGLHDPEAALADLVVMLALVVERAESLEARVHAVVAVP